MPFGLGERLAAGMLVIGKVPSGLQELYKAAGVLDPKTMVPAEVRDAYQYYEHLVAQKKELEVAMLKPLADKRHALERFRGKLSGISSQNRAEQLLAAAEERLDDWVSKQLEPLQESMAEAINGLAQQQKLIETLVRRDAVAAVVREADAQQDNEPEKVDLDTALDSMLDECYLTADFVKKVEQDFKGLRIERVESLGCPTVSWHVFANMYMQTVPSNVFLACPVTE